jgi:hypothetical protein
MSYIDSIFVIPAGAELAPHLMRGIQWSLNTGSLLSQGRRLDSRFRGNDETSGILYAAFNS